MPQQSSRLWRQATNLLRHGGLLRPLELGAVRFSGCSPLTRLITWYEGVPYITSLLLRTVGARSGDLRDAVLFTFPDHHHKGSWVIIGSVGGAPRHPSWVHNLRNDQRAWIYVNRRRLTVAAEFVEGPERDRLWLQAIAAWPPYVDYQRRAEPRRIEVIRLRPR